MTDTWIDEPLMEELHEEIEERKEMAAIARVREKGARIISLCFACCAVLMIGTFDGTDKIFTITLIILLAMMAIAAHLFALAFHEEADELGEGRDPWRR